MVKCLLWAEAGNTMAPVRGTSRFFNLPEDKRDHIIATTTEFATHGHEQANIDRIAKDAGISVGALFKYFPTKADLFLYMVQRGSATIEAKTAPILQSDASPLEMIDKLIDIIGETSITERESIQICRAMGAPGYRASIKETAAELEHYTAKQYLTVIKHGQGTGEICDDVPAEYLALLVDNQFVSLQYTLATEYYEERRHIYAADLPTDQLLETTKQFLHSALVAR